MSNTTRAVKVSSTTSMLAFLPVLCGLPVRNSLVIAPFVGKYTSRALRIGVEPSPTADGARLLASTALATLSRLDECDGVSVAVYRDEPFAKVGPVWFAALDVVLERLHQSGYQIKDAAIVAGDGWIPYFEPAAGVPRSLAEIDEAAQDVPQRPSDDVPFRVPEADPELARRVAEIMFDRAVDGSECDAFGRLRPTAPADPVDLLERALANDPANASALALARLIGQLDSEGAIDRTVLQIAFGRGTGALSWSKTLAVRSEAARAGCEPADIVMKAYQRGERRWATASDDFWLARHTRFPPRNG